MLISVAVVSDVVDNKLADKLDSRFFQIVRGKLVDAQASVNTVFDVSGGLKQDELFSRENIKTLDYLFSAAALAVSTKTSAGLIHPVIASPSVGTQTVYSFLKERLSHYTQQDSSVKFAAIDCKDIIGQAKFGENASEQISIPKLVKWRMENEESNFETKLFLLNNASAVIASGTLSLTDVISELNSISDEASFLVFLTPSTYYFARSVPVPENIEVKFARMILFEGFSTSDLPYFKEVVNARLKLDERLSKIEIDDVGLEVALSTSRGIPTYAFRILSAAIAAALLDGTKHVSSTRITQIKNELAIEDIWRTVDDLSDGQLDLLAVLASFTDCKATVYQLRDRLFLFRKSIGERSAILQQLRRLYQNDLLERERPFGSLRVNYRIKSNALPAIDYRIKQKLQSVK